MVPITGDEFAEVVKHLLMADSPPKALDVLGLSSLTQLCHTARRSVPGTGEESLSVSQTLDSRGTIWFLSWFWNAGLAFGFEQQQSQY